MPDMNPVIIIGTGIAGYTLAREFRKLNADVPLIIISADDGCSYPKPMLSNALAKGKTADEIAMFDADSMATKLAIEIITNNEVVHIEPKAQAITLADGKRYNYKQLILAVGASPVTLPIDGVSDGKVLSINSLEDYSVFRDKLVRAERVALIGPGLIGCEFANDLLNVDVAISIIGPDPYPMSTILPEPVAKELQKALESAGVEWHLGATVSTAKQCDKYHELTLTNGDIIQTDLLVSAIGLRPNTLLADAAGLNIGRGIKTDKFLQTSESNIYALGDCAEVDGLNLLFIAPIMAAAKALAKTLAGTLTAVKYSAMPVLIKTSVYPIVIASPPSDAIGIWVFEKSTSGYGKKGVFTGANNALLGFVLSGDMVVEKQSLTKQLPALLD